MVVLEGQSKLEANNLVQQHLYEGLNHLSVMIVQNLLESSRALTAKITGHLKHLKRGCEMQVNKTFHLSKIMATEP